MFGAFINVLKFAMPLYTLQILDRIPASRSVETLVMLTLIALLAITAGIALEAVRRRMLAQWGAWIEREFGPRLFLAGISGRDNRRPVSASDALGDLSTLRSFVARSAAAWLDVVWAPVFVIAVCLVHPVLGLILVAALALLLVLAIAQERMTRKPRRASGNASSDAKGIVATAERNSETVGALSMAPNLTELWRRSIETRLDESDRSEARIVVFATLVQGLYRCLYIGGLGAGIWLVIEDTLTLGGVIAANIIMRFGFRLVARAARKWRALMNARRAYRRLAAQLSVTAAADSSVAESELNAPLVLENVAFRYPGQSEPVFRRIDVSAAAGEVLCIIGPSASGKSTFSRLLTGILSPRTGQVRLGDIEIGRLPPAMQARVVGYLPQEIRLFRGSVRANIARMGDGEFEDAVAAARLAHIHDTIVRLPQGYDTEIDDETPCLSGGERKRIALARAYYGRPRLIVLDEPEANLDRRSRKALIKAIQTLKAHGSTIVVTTQATRLGKVADTVLILGEGRAAIRSGDDGRLQDEGGPEDDASNRQVNRMIPE
jgi:PrtD family type I secretion system ABC transporter